jgi:HD-GYP domain-containing protein (c-di-GMP phosphodiesterase class II)
MRLARPILHPRRYDLALLERGFVLDARYIARLRELDVRCVWVEFDGLDEVDQRVNPKIASGHMLLYAELDESIERIHDRAGIEFSVQEYRARLEKLLIDIVDDPEHEVIIYQLRSCSQRVAGHMANCAYLAMLTGAHLSGYIRQQRRAVPAHIAEDTNRLGMAALLHDIGKLFMPPEFRRISILDPRSDSDEYRSHTRIGSEQLHGVLGGTIASVALNHHQRFDGRGFPARSETTSDAHRAPPAAHQIHIFARIVGAVNVFDHLLFNGSEGVLTVVALNRFIREFVGWFDPFVVETIVQLVPPFTVGTTVELSDGRFAAVVSNHVSDPCRPVVRVLSGPPDDPHSRACGPQIDLREHDEDLCIAREDGVDVRPYLFDGNGLTRPELTTPL